MNKNEFRQFQTELEFIIKENDPSIIKVAGNLVLDSTQEQLDEYRKKFDFMVSKLFDKYGLDDKELFENFDRLWEETCEEELNSDTFEGLKKFASRFSIVAQAASISDSTYQVQTVLNSYYHNVLSYCLKTAKKKIN